MRLSRYSRWTVRFISIFLVFTSVTACFASENVVKERYSEAYLRQDPEVLIATAKHKSEYGTEYKARREDSVVELSKNDNDQVTVTTTWEEGD